MFRRLSRDGFRKIKQGGILNTAEVFCQEKLLRADDFRPVFRGFPDVFVRDADGLLPRFPRTVLQQRNPDALGSRHHAILLLLLNDNEYEFV